MKTSWQGCGLPASSDDPTQKTCPNTRTLCTGFLNVTQISWAQKGLLAFLMSLEEGEDYPLDLIITMSSDPHDLYLALYENYEAGLLVMSKKEREQMEFVLGFLQSRFNIPAPQ